MITWRRASFGIFGSFHSCDGERHSEYSVVSIRMVVLKVTWLSWDLYIVRCSQLFVLYLHYSRLCSWKLNIKVVSKNAFRVKTSTQQATTLLQWWIWVMTSYNNCTTKSVNYVVGRRCNNVENTSWLQPLNAKKINFRLHFNQ